jgi:hypothetical protein
MIEIVFNILKASVIVIGIMALWWGVQSAWRKIFAEYVQDEDLDVMADRRSCGNCGCTNICDKRKEEILEEVFSE